MIYPSASKQQVHEKSSVFSLFPLHCDRFLLLHHFHFLCPLGLLPIFRIFSLLLFLSQQVALNCYPQLHLLIAIFALFRHEYQFLRCHFGHWRRRYCRRGRLYLQVVSTHKVIVDQVGSVLAAASVSDVHGETELEIQGTDLANVFVLAAGSADACALVNSFVASPLEDCEGPEADPALLTVVLLEHAHVRVFAVALIAGHWEVRCLPSLLVYTRSRRQTSLPLHSTLIQYKSNTLMNRPSLGHMFFRRQLTKLQQKIVEDIDLKCIVQLDDWWLAEGQFPYNGCNKIFAICDQITAKDIDFHDNQTPTIIKEIVHIDFPNLRMLKLSMNKIETIQHLQHLKAPNLQTLMLNSNLITQTKSLRKCNFPNLNSLSLHENMITDISFLQHCHWSKQMRYIFIDCDLDEDEAPSIEDVTSLLKFEAYRLKKISWDYWRLGKNSPMRKAIATKFAGIEIQGKKF